jgi:hypothetical protein
VSQHEVLCAWYLEVGAGLGSADLTGDRGIENSLGGVREVVSIDIRDEEVLDGDARLLKSLD